MTNRERYITKRNEYDLMITIAENIQELGTFCAIRAVCGRKHKRKCEYKWRDLGSCSRLERDCERCIQAFLNEEANE